MTDKIIEILIQGGLSGVALGLIIFNFKVQQMFNKTIQNHFAHVEMTYKEESKAKIELAKAITALAERVNNCPFKK